MTDVRNMLLLRKVPIEELYRRGIYSKEETKRELTQTAKAYNATIKIEEMNKEVYAKQECDRLIKSISSDDE